MTFRLGLGMGLMVGSSQRPTPTTAPVNTVAPSITGILTQGQTLTADPGSWGGLPSGAFTYQWQRSGANIGGATGSTYVAQAADVSAGASALSVEVTATNDLGSTMAESAGVTIAAPLAITGTPPDGTVGVFYTFTPSATGGHTPKTFALTGTLPSDLSFNTSTGAITGTPISSGTAGGLNITVTDADGLTASLGVFDIAIATVSDEIDAPFDSVNGPTDGPSSGPYEGWSVTSAAPIADDYEFTVLRQGFDEEGLATSYLDTLYVTRQVRQPYPNHASLESDTWALSDYIYSTDTPSGEAANNSALTSPKPVANWASPDRLVVGNTIGGAVVPVEVVVFHRNARNGGQVACMIFTVSDGTTTITTAPVATTVVSGRAGDRNAVLVYRLPETDISTLTATTSGIRRITVNAKAYPWIGAAASVLDSADQSARREFSPRYFECNPTLAVSPPYAYVSSVGVDASGVVSTNAATAAASPFLTIGGAINGIHTALSATTGIDGAIIRLQDGTHILSSSAIIATRTQKLGVLTITRSPTSTNRASVIIQQGASAFRARFGGSLVTVTEGALRFTDITLQRSGVSAFTGEAATQLELTFDDIDFDANSTANTLFTNAHGRWYGATVTNVPASAASLFGTSGVLQHRCFRGLSVDLNSSQITDWLTVGCSLTRPGVGAVQTSCSGAITAYNKVRNPNSGNAFRQPAESVDVNGYVVVQNVIEYTSATDGMVFRISGDSATGDNTHIIIHNNTIVGAYQAGRWNAFYDEGTTPRTSLLASVIGNIAVSYYTKSDVFRGVGGGGDASTRLGNWAYMYGVGCFYNWSQYQSNSPLGGDQAQAYGGVGSLIGASQITPQMANSSFTNYQATTVAAGPTYTGGAGGGTYTLTSDALTVASMVEVAVLSHDLDGTARPAVDDAAGAYASP